jgi:hypothetical protein
VAGFVQIIEFKTSRVNEIRDLMAEMEDRLGAGAALRGTVTADLDRPGYYLSIVEFGSRQSAMENSARPEVGEFASRMAALCDEPPRFYNLDVVQTWPGGTTAATVKKTVTETASVAAEIAAAGAGMVRQRLQQRRAGGGRGGATEAAPSETGTVPTSEESSAEVIDRVVISPESDYPEGQRSSF